MAPGSTRLRLAAVHVQLRRGEGGVRDPTMIYCDQIQTILRFDVEPAPLGEPLSLARMGEIEAALLIHLDIQIA